MEKLLEVSGLSTAFEFSDRTINAVNGVSFSLNEGESLAIVGESGSGKSVTAYSILRLVAPPGRVTAGKIVFEGRDLLTLSEAEMREVRGNRISMVFQEPMTSLNPVFRIGRQIAEGLILHRGMSPAAAREETERLLVQVGIPPRRFDDYPHQMSGGLRQRVMIAMALACNPRLLIADEPTTALDVTIQAQILELIDSLRIERTMGLILITHDLGIVAERSHKTAVMYGGRIVEYAPTAELFAHPLHPYTAGLLASLPQNAEPGKPLASIPGNVPTLAGKLPGCGFAERCTHSLDACFVGIQELQEVRTGHFVRCSNR